MVTAKRIPVPEPIAPKKSAITDSPPIQRPPKAAAVGMYLRREGPYEHRVRSEGRSSSHCLPEFLLPIKLVHHGRLPVPPHDHLLLLQLLCDLRRRGETRAVNMKHGCSVKGGPKAQTHIFGGRSRHFDPRLGEKGARAQHEDDVDDGVNGIVQNRPKRLRGRKVVAQAAHRVGTSRSAAGGVLRIRPKTSS